MDQRTERVIIGGDPHKLSATFEVVDPQEQVLGAGRFTTDRAGYNAMRTNAKTPTSASSSKTHDGPPARTLARVREGTAGRLFKSSAVDLLPHIDTSDQPLPGPAEKTLRRTG